MRRPAQLPSRVRRARRYPPHRGLKPTHPTRASDQQYCGPICVLHSIRKEFTIHGHDSTLTSANPQESLRDKAFALMNRDDFDLTQADLDVLSNLYDRELEPDNWLPEGQRYRERAYQCFDLEVAGLSWTPIAEPAPYRQSMAVNRVAGGIERRFAVIPVDHPATAIAARVAMSVARVLLGADVLDTERHPRCLVDVHYIRITAPGKPCPEGMHRDGLLAGSAHLLRRNNITGDISELYDNVDSENPLHSGRLTDPMDSFVFHDSRVRHFTRDIERENPTAPGFRDALLIGFRTQ
ncbi:2OG-Fe dioxygenase family protein [Nocardia sp. NPDC058666]|uniref:2OG-Fe dioxygenase family protein n=1 Tax=Nocardia sp. NPDC058666 TaxID=3346587 RepID=UPI00364FEAFE